MRNPVDVSNRDDLIDSRNVIARIEELESELQSAQDELESAQDELREGVEPEACACGTCGLSWVDNRASGTTPVPAGRCPFEHLHEEAEELKALKALANEAEGYAADWSYGETLIRDDYFGEYARQLADDLGLLKKDNQWPYTCIDWEQAAEELQQDYTAVDYDGVTYWVR